MRLARVVGNVVSTIKDDGYNGRKLMIVEYFDPETRKPQGPRMIAFDCADAGVGDIVMVNIDGGAGNMLLDDTYAIVDLVICGVLDSYSINGKVVPIVGGRFAEEDPDSPETAEAPEKSEIAENQEILEASAADEVEEIPAELTEVAEDVTADKEEGRPEKIWLSADSFPQEPEERPPWPPIPHAPGQEKIWLTADSFRAPAPPKREEQVVTQVGSEEEPEADAEDPNAGTWNWSAFSPRGGNTDV